MEAECKTKASKPSFNLELNNKPNKEGKYQVFIRITKDKKHKRIKTTYAASSLKDWNPEKQCFRSSESNAEVWNEGLEKELDNVKNTYRELRDNKQSTSLENIANEATQEETATSFVAFFKQKVEEIYNEGRIRDWKKVNGTYNKFVDFLSKKKKKDIAIIDINHALILDFDKYLRTLHNARHTDKMLHQNTIVVVHRIMRRIVNKAIAENLMPLENNPYLKFKLKELPTSREKLTIAEIGLLEALELEKGTLLWHTRNMFLFSFYSTGIRAEDLLQLRWNNIQESENEEGKPETRLVYRMAKNNKIKDTVLVDNALDILRNYYSADKQLADYIFPLMKASKPYAQYVTQEERNTMQVELKKMLVGEISSCTAILNKELKKLAQMAGISKNISTHIARHSFASYGMKQGATQAEMKVFLEHTNGTTTERYTGSLDTSSSDNALRRIFAKKEPGTRTLKSKVSALLDNLTEEQLAAMLATLEK